MGWGVASFTDFRVENTGPWLMVHSGTQTNPKGWEVDQQGAAVGQYTGSWAWSNAYWGLNLGLIIYQLCNPRPETVPF